ncbi:M48 family metallopeptidase [Aureisphaera galaxeae]|uniref:M48 family metallopeptidase n=1 Tax=Aureisphaera galaxeae TaxID=1538023 RepID=UPI002350015E|nr:M48 family metallopeptidase [Aureisphaera galaxeae]MDC8005625.1 M48 family metallopeptidase [Aureisphaera galaxeae]
MRLFFALTLFLVPLCHSNAQSETLSPKLKDSIFNYLDQSIGSKIASYQGENKRKVSEFWEERKEKIKDDIENNAFIFDDALNSELNKIISQVYAANPEVDPSAFYFFVNRSPVPNAASYGNGSFSLNTGLFSLAENDDELAFIICHEIAHYLLSHSDTAIDSHIESYESKETRKKVNKISNRDVGKFSKAMELLKDINYKLYKKSRSAEIEADSLGMELFKKTGYNPASATSILAKLDFEKKAILNKYAPIKKHLHTNGYPFKDNWLKKENNSLFDLEESSNDYSFDKDSTKTHPAIPKRIELLRTKIASEDENSGVPQVIHMLKEISLAKTIEGAIENNQLDIALFYLLTTHESADDEKSRFYDQMALVLKKMYELKKEHSIGKYVAPISPFSEEEELNKIKQFISNLEPKNIRKLGYWFCQENKDLFANADIQKETHAYFKKLNPNID